MVLRFFSASSPPRISSFTAMLDFVAFPAIIVGGKEHRILAANLEVVRQSGYSAQRLTDLAWEQLFPELSWEALMASQGEEVITFFQHRDGSSRKVACRARSLSNDGSVWLVVFSSPADAKRKGRQETSLERVIRYAMEGKGGSDADKTLGRVLLEMVHVVGAVWGALYLVERPVYRLRSKVGAPPDLPIALPLENSAHLVRSHIFTPSETAATALHAVVRTADAPYMVVVPLGERKAVEGFMAIGYGEPPPPGTLRRVTVLGRGLRQVLLYQSRQESEQTEKERLRRAVGVLNVVLKQAHESILLFDNEMRLVSLSHSAEELLGYTTEESRGAAFSDLLVGETALETAARQVLALGRPQEVSAHLLRRDGTEFPAGVRLVPWGLSAKEEVRGLVVLLHDQSKEEQYRAKTERLMWRAMLGDVLASFAHEVRDPLNSISTGLEWLELSLGEDASQREIVANLQQDIERLNHLVTHLLDYSRARALQLTPLDVGSIIEGIMRRWQGRFERLGVEPSYHIEPDVPLALGDRLSLEQVFINLIDNALQAVRHQEGDRFVGVQVAGKASENGTPWVEVTVTDNGPGFTEEVRQRLFEPFFTTREDGTGLGLTITKQLVTAHRGSIEAVSYPGGGTVFRVRLRAVEKA